MCASNLKDKETPLSKDEDTISALHSDISDFKAKAQKNLLDIS
jgi:hypothetical protein